MHNSSMYQNRPQQQQQQAQVDIYDINVIATQFQGWNFGLGDPFDRITPNIALMTINEIQGQAQRGHPIRVGMFNIISNNAFNNADFQDLVNVIMVRIQAGMIHGEWHSLDTAAQNVIARAVKCCGSAMAAADQEFMRELPQDDARAVQDNAAIWNHLLALAQGKAQYVPFSQLTTNNQFSPVNNTTHSALEAARGLAGSTAGSFVESGNYDSAVIRGGNNAGQSSGRYARRMEAMTGTLHGSMQNALKEQQNNQPAAAPYQPRRQTLAPLRGTNAIEKFDSDITDFSKSLDTVPEPAPVVEEVKPIFTVKIGDKVYNAIRELNEGGAKKWKPSEAQRFHPAWCKRTHRVRYFETTDDVVVIVVQELKESEKEIAMDYEAHAIDPTKGLPDQNIPKKPVREEAKVLYSKEVKVNINIVVSDKTSMEEDINGCIRTARLSAELSTSIPDAYVRKSVISTPIVYESDCDADDDRIVISAIANSRTFTEAAKLLKQVGNPLARRTIDKMLTHAVNTACTCELNVPVRISSFEEDAADLIKVVEDNYGALFGETLRSKQSLILLSNVIVASALDMKAHANATLTVDDQEELSEEKLKMILFLSYNAMAVWVKFTDDEMAIGVPDKGAAQIQENTYGALYEVAKTVFEQVTEKDIFTEFHIVTKDNVRYRLHRSLISKNCFLISKEVKPAGV